MKDSDRAPSVALRPVEIDRLRAEIEATWFHIAHGYDIEPREFFEVEAPTNGFKYALAQAIHHIWKREPKVAALTADVARLTAALQQAQTLLRAIRNVADVADPSTMDQWVVEKINRYLVPPPPAGDAQ